MSAPQPKYFGFVSALAMCVGLGFALGMSPFAAAWVQEPAAATTVWRARVWTGNPEQPWAEAVAFRGEKILAVGALAAVQQVAGTEATFVDWGDRLVTPGWIDSHVHLLDGGFRLTSVQLRAAATPQEFVRRIAEFAGTVPPGTWITGGDWDHTLWAREGEPLSLPDRAWIDALTPQHPVWIQRLDGHMALANTAALVAAGLGEEVPEVAGGEIVRDAAGRMTGVLKDNAMALVEQAVPRPTPQQTDAAIAAASDYLAAQGVTAVHHMGTWEELEALRRVHARGELRLRVYACTPLADWKRLAREVNERGRGDHLLRIGGLKGFVDGSLGSHTAAFLQPYRDDPLARGLLVNSPENLLSWIRGADAAGLQVAVHAIGDRANRMLLDWYQQVATEHGPRDRRFRIEHAQHLTAEDIPRFAAQQVIPSMQPYHAIDDGRWAEALIGLERCRTTYPFNALQRAGARLAFGSDWFVAPPLPLLGMYAAATRRTLDDRNPAGWIPEEKISVEGALQAYTQGSACAGFQENQLGSLQPGKLADLVVVDRDITRIPPAEIRDAHVVLTVLGGEVVFRREPTTSSGDYPREKILHYVRSNQDGSEAEQVYVYLESPTRTQVYKMRSPGTSAALVIAELDPTAGRVTGLIAGRLNRAGGQDPQVWLRHDLPQSKLLVNFGQPDGPPQLSADLPGRAPWRMYDFDLADTTALNAGRPAPRTDWEFDLALAWPEAGPDESPLRVLGTVQATYRGEEEHLGRNTCRYEVQGAGLGEKGGGMLWLDAAHGFVVEAAWGLPNHPGYRDFRLVLQEENTGAAAWQELLRRHFATAKD